MKTTIPSKTKPDEESIRTIEMNNQQWPYLDAFSKQREWPINGRIVLIDRLSWKNVLTAGFVKYMLSIGDYEATLVRKYVTQDIAMGFALNAPNNYDVFGTVMMGYHTSKFPEVLWPYWMEFLKAAAAECEIKVPVSKKQAERYGQF